MFLYIAVKAFQTANLKNYITDYKKLNLCNLKQLVHHQQQKPFV